MYALGSIVEAFSLFCFLQENCEEFEAVVSAQCDALIEAIRARQAQLLECIRQDKEMRVRALKEQVTTCTARLQQTTALLQFCIEALKENDSAAFLQVSAFYCCHAKKPHLDSSCGCARFLFIYNKIWYVPLT